MMRTHASQIITRANVQAKPVLITQPVYIKESRPFRNSSGQTTWYHSKSQGGVLENPPDIKERLELGDLYIHDYASGDTDRDVWCLMESDKRGQAWWYRLTANISNNETIKHPVFNRYLKFRQNGTPSWTLLS